MAPAFDLISEWTESVRDFYRSSPCYRAICLGIGLLALLLLVDGLLGFQSGLRMVYVLPLWMATKKGGRYAGTAVLLAITFSLAVADAQMHSHEKIALANFGLQTGVLYLLMMIFDSVESRLRTVTTMATRDALTGLHNRLAIEDRGRRAVDRATVVAQPLAIAMVDCDRFKELNDKFGHAYGDDVLRILARTMKRNLPGDVTVGRTGGDEFVVIMPNRNRAQATSMLEATLEKFMAHTEIVGRGAGFSFGVATLGTNGFEYERLVRAADANMYQRKTGRSAPVNVACR